MPLSTPSFRGFRMARLQKAIKGKKFVFPCDLCAASLPPENWCFKNDVSLSFLGEEKAPYFAGTTKNMWVSGSVYFGTSFCIPTLGCRIPMCLVQTCVTIFQIQYFPTKSSAAIQQLPRYLAHSFCCSKKKWAQKKTAKQIQKQHRLQFLSLPYPKSFQVSRICVSKFTSLNSSIPKLPGFDENSIWLPRDKITNQQA